MENLLLLNFNTNSNLLQVSLENEATEIKESLTKGIIYIRSGRKLICYKYETAQRTWTKQWEYDNFFHTDALSKTEHYPWIVMDVLKNGQDVIAIRNHSGLQLYKLNNTKNGLQRLYSESFFHDLHQWNDSNRTAFVMGRLYPDKNILGIFSRNAANKIFFHAVQHHKKGYKIMQLKKNSQPVLPKYFNDPATKFSFAEISNQIAIVARSNTKFEVFQFEAKKSKWSLEKIANLETALAPSQDIILFGKMHSANIQNLLHFNETGLRVYDFNSNENLYEAKYYFAEFTKHRGWSEEHQNTVQLVDFNNDGFNSLVYKGPKGLNVLAHNKASFEWKHFLLTESLAINEKHAVPVKLIANTNNSRPFMFIIDQVHGLRWAEVLEKPAKNLPQITEISKPKYEDVDSDEEEYEIPEQSVDKEVVSKWLRQQLDYKSLRDAVHRTSGKPSFILPIIDIPDAFGISIQNNIHYDGQNSNSDVLGLGWHFPTEYISVDYQGSIFPEDHRYFLVLKHLYAELKYNATLSNSAQTIWNVPQHPEYTMKHSIQKGNWELYGKTRKYTFGFVDGNKHKAIEYSLSWTNWRGLGSDSAGLKMIPKKWFLVKQADNHGNSLHYHYDIVTETVNDNKFTRGAYLTKITDNRNVHVDFHYNEKEPNEYKIEPIRSNKNMLQTASVLTRYLSAYHVKTLNYEQAIHFEYEIVSDKRLLRKIKQLHDPTNQPVLSFDYTVACNEFQLEHVLLPSNMELFFQYKIQESPVEPTSQIFKFELQPSIVSGPDYVLICDLIDPIKQVNVRIANMDVSKILYTSESYNDSALPKLGKYHVQNYYAIPANGFFAIVLIYEHEMELCIFRRNADNTWNVIPQYYTLPSETDVKATKDSLIVVEKSRSLYALSWDSKKNIWTRKCNLKLNSSTVLQPFHRGFYFYDDKLLRVSYTNRKNEWQTKVLRHIPNLINSIETVIHKFDLDGKVSKTLIETLKSDMLSINGNQIVLRSISEENAKLYADVYLCLLDEDYDVTLIEKHSLFVHDLKTYKYTWFAQNKDNSTSTIVLQHKLTRHSRKFKVQVDDMFGPFKDQLEKVKIDGLEKIRSKVPKKYQERELRSFFKHFYENRKKELDKIVEHMSFIIDINEYGVIITGNEIICANTKFIFTGKNWKWEEISSNAVKQLQISVPLRDKYVLDKENRNSTFKLYEQKPNGQKADKVLLDLGTAELKSLKLMYPVYIAYEREEQPVEVLLFKNEHFVDFKYSLPIEETLTQWITAYTMFTSYGEIDKNSTVIARTMFNKNSLLPVCAVHKLFWTTGTEFRELGYDFDFPSSEAMGYSIVFTKSSIIPGGSSKIAGRIENHFDTYLGRFIDRKIFDSDDNLVVLKTEEPEQDKSGTELRNVIKDKTNKVIVASFGPYEATEGTTGYYGFEAYEVNINNVWKFDKKYLRNGDTLTGNNFFELQHNSLKATFSPGFLNTVYVVSCWLRSGTELELNTHYSFLRTSIVTENNTLISEISAKAKLNTENWYYLEAVINLPEIINKKYAKVEHLAIKPKIYINVHISSESSDEPLDVDNVRFSPLNCPFQAFTYNIETGQKITSLQHNGNIERYIYDDYQIKIAEVNTEDQLRYFKTYAKNYWQKYNAKNIFFSELEATNPTAGMYENFLHNSFYKRWNLLDTWAWRIKSEELHHTHQTEHKISMRKIPTLKDTLIVRFHYDLSQPESMLKMQWTIKEFLSFTRQHTKKGHLMYNSVGKDVPANGEVVVILGPHRIIVWVEGHLCFESARMVQNKSLDRLEIIVKHKVIIKSLLLLENPKIFVKYLDDMKLIHQEIILENDENVNVREILYDIANRPAVTTLWTRIASNNNENMFDYHENFVVNNDPYSQTSFWQTGILQGKVNDLNPEASGYCYSQILYKNQPMNEKLAFGRPGKDFSVNGKYKWKFESCYEVPFLDNVFPSKLGFYRKVIRHPSGAEEINVFDNYNNKRAVYIHVPGYNHILTTFEYNKNNKLVLELPPNYHEEAKTLFRRTPWKLDSNQELQNAVGKIYTYDETQKLNKVKAPDSGEFEFMYNPEGYLRFKLHRDNEGKIDSIIYYTYNILNQITSVGNVPSFTSLKTLEEARIKGSAVPGESVSQIFSYANNDYNPSMRGRFLSVANLNKDHPIVEETYLNSAGNVQYKSIYISSLDTTFDISYKYERGKIVELTYPTTTDGKNITINYNYNSQSQLKGIGKDHVKANLVAYNYDAQGRLVQEHHRQESRFNFTRDYDFHVAGMLENIRDTFLEENLSYTSGSYGGPGQGEGTITRTTFTPKWYKMCDINPLAIRRLDFLDEDIDSAKSKFCFEFLKKLGYIDSMNRPVKQYYPKLELNMPLLCRAGKTARIISHVLTLKGFPKKYGHAYDYGNFQEMTKAKYFINEEVISPLQPESFLREIPNTSRNTSIELWNLLTTDSFIIEDKEKDEISFAHGKSGTKSIFNKVAFEELIKIDPKFVMLVEPLKALFSKVIIDRTVITKDFYKIYLDQWMDAPIKTSGDKKFIENELFSKVWNYLESRNYVGSNSENNLKILNEKFRRILKDHNNILPDIVRILHNHFGKELGESSGDIEFYDIDPNGNQRKYYTGFDRYELFYQKYTNQIRTMNFTAFNKDLKSVQYEIEHDSFGNVVKAGHKAIKNIEYDPISHKTTCIKMNDGRQLHFYYDTHGERILKRVKNAENQISKELYYIRDEKGKCLMELDITYLSKNLAPDLRVTKYIYGYNNGLISFIRNDKYYNVVTDHEGSIRLVVLDGEIVASYDYLPYGQILRKYGKDPDGHISYRYTGQELDIETGLYNYHARLYDPALGRFYQIDPKEQYPSPYKYAGNSPVSFVDPNGEFAFIFIAVGLVLGAVGGYLGGAAANGNFNPLKWNWKSWDTWKGIFTGFAVGFTIPFNGALSIATLTGIGLSTGLAVGALLVTVAAYAYLHTSLNLGSFNPADWDFKDPKTYYSLFEGISKGAGFFSDKNEIAGKLLEIKTRVTDFLSEKYDLNIDGLTSEIGNFIDELTKGLTSSLGKNLGKISGSSEILQNIGGVAEIFNQLKLINKVDTFDLGKWALGLRTVKNLNDDWENNIQINDFDEFVNSNIKSIINKTKDRILAFAEDICTTINLDGKNGDSESKCNKILTSFENAKEQFDKIRSVLKVIKRSVRDIELNSYQTNNTKYFNATNQFLYPQIFEKHIENLIINNNHTSAVSSASSIRNNMFLNHIPILHIGKNIFEVLLDAIKIRKKEPLDINPLDIHSKTSKTQYEATLKNCVPWARSGNQYINGVTCLTQNSVTMIFTKSEYESAATPLQALEDNYNNCYSTEWNNKPSVFCEGEHTNIIHTTELPKRIFDQLDGWIMLGSIAPEVCKEIKSLFAFIKGVLVNKTNKESIYISAERKQNWKNRTEIIESLIKKLQKTVSVKEIKWAIDLLEDSTEEILKLNTGTYMSKETFSILEEKLDALYEDLLEMAEYVNPIINNIFTDVHKLSYVNYAAFNN